MGDRERFVIHESTKLTPNGLYNRNVLSEAIFIRNKLLSAEAALLKIQEEKYSAASPKYTSVSKNTNHSNISYCERESEKQEEINMLSWKLEIAKENVSGKIGDLPLSDDKKKLLRKCFVELLRREQAFSDCNMSRSDGFRKYVNLLNEINL